MSTTYKWTSFSSSFPSCWWSYSSTSGIFWSHWKITGYLSCTPSLKIWKDWWWVLMVDVQDLSTNQKCLKAICNAVIKALNLQDLSWRNPGAVNQFGYLTTGNRILRLFIWNEKPSHELTTPTKFVFRVYAPMWFSIQCKPSCESGARHLLQAILGSRHSPENLWSVIDSVIQRNRYFGNVENLFCPW